MTQAIQDVTQVVRFKQPMSVEEFGKDAVRYEQIFAGCFRGVNFVGRVTAEKVVEFVAIFNLPQLLQKLIAGYYEDFHLVDVAERLVDTYTRASYNTNQPQVEALQALQRKLDNFRGGQESGFSRLYSSIPSHDYTHHTYGQLEFISRFYVPNDYRGLFDNSQARWCALRWPHCKDQQAEKDTLVARLQHAKALEAQGKELQPAKYEGAFPTEAFSSEALRQLADPDILRLM